MRSPTGTAPLAPDSDVPRDWDVGRKGTTHDSRSRGRIHVPPWALCTRCVARYLQLKLLSASGVRCRLPVVSSESSFTGPGPLLLPVGHLPGGSAPTRRSICRSKRRRRRWQCACFTGNRVSWSLCRGPAPRLRADYIVLSHRPSSTRCREPRASRSDHAGRESASHREAPPRVGPDSRVETLDRPAQVPGWRRALVKLAPRMHHSTP